MCSTKQQFSFPVSKPLNDSPSFQTFDKQNFDESECVEDMSGEHFEEVSCELQNTSNFEEHIDVTTAYLSRYMAQGDPEYLIQRM